PELGELLPPLAAPALRALGVTLALLECVAVADQPIEALLQQPLLFTQVEIHRSQPQDRLGYDVLLDLVGAAIDRGFAPVEVGRGDRAGPFGADRRIVPNFSSLRLRLVGVGVRAE